MTAAYVLKRLDDCAFSSHINDMTAAIHEAPTLSDELGFKLLGYLHSLTELNRSDLK